MTETDIYKYTSILPGLQNVSLGVIWQQTIRRFYISLPINYKIYFVLINFNKLGITFLTRKDDLVQFLNSCLIFSFKEKPCKYYFENTLYPEPC